MPLDGQTFVLPDLSRDAERVRLGLHNAANRVERGWCQDDYEDIHGNVCAVGAILDVIGSMRLRRKAIKRLAHSLSLNLTLAHTSVTEWNDTPGRTQAEVVSALRKAAQI